MCPYAYQTSRWIRTVRDHNGLQVNWRFFSLEEINHQEGKKHPWEREWSYGWSMMRIGALLRRQSMAAVDAWYERAARALHVDGHKPHEKAVARHLLDELGFDPELVDQAIADPTTSDEVMDDHNRVVDAGGYGVPTLFFPDGQCLFGPVLIDPPTGDADCDCGMPSSRGRSSRTSTSCSDRRPPPTSRRSPRRSAHILRPGTGFRSIAARSSASTTSGEARVVACRHRVRCAGCSYSTSPTRRRVCRRSARHSGLTRSTPRRRRQAPPASVFRR